MEPHVPPSLPPEIDYSLLIEDITKSHRALGNLSGLLLHPAINPNLLITPLLTKEAVLSSAIEGTVATLEDVFRHEANERDIQDEKIRIDVQEIVNYRRAIEQSMHELEKRAIGENLLKQAHYILLDSVRGSKKNRGYYRKELVHIGRPGSPVENATFIPAPPDLIPDLMNNWEFYINSTNEKDPLVQIAVAHYQFEAIHPFLDGNGRMGRIIIPLFLCERKLLDHPILYISEFFETNRNAYIDSLRAVDENGDWIQWVRFFLTGLQIQALKTQTSVLKILNLYQDLKQKVASMGSLYGGRLLDIVFVRPVVTYSYLKDNLGVSHQTVYNLINKFANEGILTEMTDRKRNRLFVFSDLLDILR